MRGPHWIVTSGLVFAALVGRAPAQECEQLIMGSDATVQDRYGSAIATSGDHIIIGAPWHDAGPGPDGAAYIFRLTGTDWTEEQKLPAPAVPGDEAFGQAVAIEGDVALIGAPGGAHGAAYVYRRNGATWIPEARLVGPDEFDVGEFGMAVAVHDDVAIVGAPYTGDSHTGMAFVFRFNGKGWSREAELTAPSGGSFGAAVGVYGDVLAIGAPYAHASGAVHLYQFDGAAWGLVESISNFGAPYEYLGCAVVLGPDDLLIGARGEDGYAGAVYCYGRVGASIGEPQRLVAPDRVGFEQFGSSLALASSTLLVGAPFDETSGWDGGAVWVFERDGGAWAVRHKMLAAEPWLPQYFGTAVGISGGMAVIGTLEQAFLQPLVTPAACDCNDNGQQDWTDIRRGISPDVDGDGVPDECACNADLDGSGDVDFNDLLAVLAAWGPCAGCAEDLDADDDVAFSDLLIVLGTWGTCP